MNKHFNELYVFLIVAQLNSFTRAAQQLGVSPSALSHAMNALEARLGIKLLNRTTRSVALTEAGQQLYATLAPALEEIDAALETVNGFRAHPMGRLRISVPRSVAACHILPLFRRFSEHYPDIVLELAADNGFIDIVKEGFDAGVRLGESVAPGMVAVRITPDMSRAVVGAPAYFAHHPPPQTPHDLRAHNCIGYRKISSGELHRWAFAKDGETLNIAVRGNLILDDAGLMLDAATDGIGLAYTADSYAAPYLANGRLQRVLADWCPPFPGFYLYYPGRRQISAALRALIDALKVA